MLVCLQSQFAWFVNCNLHLGVEGSQHEAGNTLWPMAYTALLYSRVNAYWVPKAFAC